MGYNLNNMIAEPVDANVMEGPFFTLGIEWLPFD